MSVYDERRGRRPDGKHAAARLCETVSRRFSTVIRFAIARRLLLLCAFTYLTGLGYTF